MICLSLSTRGFEGVKSYKKELDFDELCKDGDDVSALRLLAKEYYENGKMGMARRKLLERCANRLEHYENLNFVYEDVPSRSKKTSEGIFAKQHICSGRTVVIYDEEEEYHVVCENCGSINYLKAKSMDEAITIWNSKGLNQE